MSNQGLGNPGESGVKLLGSLRATVPTPSPPSARPSPSRDLKLEAGQVCKFTATDFDQKDSQKHPYSALRQSIHGGLGLVTLPPWSDAPARFTRAVSVAS